jgi:hypothetical protein
MHMIEFCPQSETHSKCINNINMLRLKERDSAPTQLNLQVVRWVAWANLFARGPTEQARASLRSVPTERSSAGEFWAAHLHGGTRFS